MHSVHSFWPKVLGCAEQGVNNNNNNNCDDRKHYCTYLSSEHTSSSRHKPRSHSANARTCGAWSAYVTARHADHTARTRWNYRHSCGPPFAGQGATVRRPSEDKRHVGASVASSRRHNASSRYRIALVVGRINRNYLYQRYMQASPVSFFLMVTWCAKIRLSGTLDPEVRFQIQTRPFLFRTQNVRDLTISQWWYSG